MKILLAKDAGYCFGVRDAVKLAEKSGQDYESVFMLGDIVHNEEVVNDLSKSGSVVVNSLDEIPQDKPVLFRAHGTDPQVWKDAQNKKLNIIDEIITEPLGGAHRDYDEISLSIKESLIKNLSILNRMSKEELLDRRYKRLLEIGI